MAVESTETTRKIMTAIGLMSGTSMDGIDIAILRTDGFAHVEFGAHATIPYDDDMRESLRGILGADDDRNGRVTEVARALTREHADATVRMMRAQGLDRRRVDIIGFHGHTILHEPNAGRTRQIGDGKLLAVVGGVPVVGEFRIDDVAAGGQGAPLAPLYHQALARDTIAGGGGPVAILNLGGVANVTWIGGDGFDDIRACDTGPASALLDDFVKLRTGESMDRDGKLALAGIADGRLLSSRLNDSYFSKPAPKSLDRGYFHGFLDQIRHLSAENAAATLVGFTVGAVAKSESLFPAPVKRWLVTGGGRHNQALMAGLRAELDAPVEPVEAVGWNGDALEAQAFAYLAVRSVKGLPLSVPGSTGVVAPCPGGRLFKP